MTDETQKDTITIDHAKELVEKSNISVDEQKLIIKRLESIKTLNAIVSDANEETRQANARLKIISTDRDQLATRNRQLEKRNRIRFQWGIIAGVAGTTVSILLSALFIGGS